MNLVRFSPNTLSNCRTKTTSSVFDELFDDFFGPAFHAGPATHTGSRRTLQVDIYEQENVLIIEAEMPGVAKEDVTLDVKGKQLTLGYEKKQENDVEDNKRYRRERSFGSFQRAFTLPFEINSDMVEANLVNGVLKVKISKPEEQQKKQITIN